MNTPRQIRMVGFLQAQNCSIAPGSWRHPAAMTDFTTPEYFQRLGRVLEEGKFHLAFFDDRIALSPAFFVGASLAAVLIASATVFGQAWRVARAEPARALRHE